MGRQDSLDDKAAGMHGGAGELLTPSRSALPIFLPLPEARSVFHQLQSKPPHQPVGKPDSETDRLGPVGPRLELPPSAQGQTPLDWLALAPARRSQAWSQAQRDRETEGA